MTDTYEMTYEALCSALYNLPFSRFLGERPDQDTGNETAWFRLTQDPTVERVNVRENPKIMRIAIRKEAEGIITVKAEWPNVHSGQMLFGEKNFHIPTLDVAQHDLMEATTGVITTILEDFGDILSGTGVAGDIADLAPESAAGEVDDDDDLAATDAEAGRE